MLPSVLRNNFTPGENFASPVVECFEQKIDYDKDLNPVISYCKVDAQKIIDSNGKDSDWSLSVLLKAGINPSFPIHTSMNSRLECVGILGDITSQVDKFFESQESVEPKETE